MTAKISADATGTKVTIGNAAENALEIDATAKTIKALAPYSFPAQTISPLTATLDAAGFGITNLLSSSVGSSAARVDQTTNKLPLAGGTVTGPLLLSNTGTALTCNGNALFSSTGTNNMIVDAVVPTASQAPFFRLRRAATVMAQWQFPSDNLMRFGTTGGADWYLTHLGNAVATVSSAGVTNTSDARSKSNIRPAKVGLANILALNPVLFERNGITELGLTAQNIEAAGIEHTIIETPHQWDGEDSVGTLKSVNHQSMIAALVAAVKELTAEVEALKSK